MTTLTAALILAAAAATPTHRRVAAAPAPSPTPNIWVAAEEPAPTPVASAAPAPAWDASPRRPARVSHEFGAQGAIEIGGTFGLASSNSHTDNGGSSSGTAVTITPTAGYFVAENLEMLGAIGLQTTSNSYRGGGSSASGVGFGIGAGYFLPSGNMKIGPCALLRYETDSQSQNDDAGNHITVRYSGPGAEFDLMAKVPVGASALITAGVGLQYRTIDADITYNGASGSDSGTQTTFGTSVGLSMFF